MCFLRFATPSPAFQCWGYIEMGTQAMRTILALGLALGLALALALGLAAVAPLAAAAQERQLGTHEHGRGTLNIAIEGTQVSLEFEAPGADIVGFEAAAKTARQKAAV